MTVNVREVRSRSRKKINSKMRHVVYEDARPSALLSRQMAFEVKG